jgi:hypothetical protein
VLVALLAGCAGIRQPSQAPPPTRTEPTAPAGRPTETVRPEAPAAAPETRQSTRQAARQYAAQGKRPLSLKTSCRFSDETGYNGRLDMVVDNDDVRSLDAEVNIPRHGSCRFALPDFRQTGPRPGVLLSGVADSCNVRMWEQGARVSVAFTRCAAHCSGGSHEYLWPILVDTRTGECS